MTVKTTVQQYIDAQTPVESLAETAIETTEATTQDHYCLFALQDNWYAITVNAIQEIRSWSEPTSLPNTPNHISGVINLRGAIVPLVDLRQKFALAEANLAATTITIIVTTTEPETGKTRTVGLVVDDVTESVAIEKQAIKPAPDMGDNITTKAIAGLASVEQKLVQVLDIDNLLNQEALA